jgi:sulfur carrier protein ThiS adenylyltransferase
MNIFLAGLKRYFSDEQLNRILAVKVGIAGAGGLGSNCASNLVRSGFKNFVICDFDVVEPSNLNRQFYFLNQIGKPKVEMLKENLLLINPELNIDARMLRLDAANIKESFCGCDIIVEAFDKAECKKMIAEAWACTAKLFVTASGIAGFGDADAIITKNVRKGFYIVGDSISEVTGLMPPCSPRVNIAAAKLADIILERAVNGSFER